MIGARPSHPARKGRQANKIRTLRPLHPNVGIEAIYERRLHALIDEMKGSYQWWLRAAYRRAPPPNMATDELSSSTLRQALRDLGARWMRRFDEMARDLAAYFATSVSQRVDGTLKRALEDEGFAIEWRMTRAQRDVLNAIVHENVSLIRSIPREQHAKVEQLVMRSVQTGRDVGGLTDDLFKAFSITKSRASLIARDQNNKATARLGRIRTLEAGITEAIWVHSHGGKPRYQRPTHVRAGAERTVYSIAKGWFDPHEQKWIWPGTLINCRCISRPILPGMSRFQAQAA